MKSRATPLFLKRRLKLTNKLLQIKIIKIKLAKKFGSKCHICKTKVSRKGFTIHHVWYIQNDVTYSQFPKNTSGKLEYYIKLAPMVKANPKRFRYLCNPCHQSLERFLRFGDVKINALFKERKRTIKLRGEHHDC